MAEQLSILYAPRHQAISAFLGIVATTPEYVDDGDIWAFSEGTKFTLKVNKGYSDWPTATKWMAHGEAHSLGQVSRELTRFLSTIWFDAPWVRERDQVFWFPARPLTLECERDLLQRFYSERLRRASAA